MSDCCVQNAYPNDCKELRWPVHARPFLIPAPVPPSWFCIICAGNGRTKLCSCCLSLLQALRVRWPSPCTGGRHPAVHLRGTVCFMWQGQMHTQRIWISEDESLLTVVSTNAQQGLEIYNWTALLTSSGKMHEALERCNLCAVKLRHQELLCFFREDHEHGSFDWKMQGAWDVHEK